MHFLYVNRVKDLMKLLKEINRKDPSIKLEYKISKNEFSFQDTKICIKDNKLPFKVFKKKADHQTFLNINFKHSK